MRISSGHIPRVVEEKATVTRLIVKAITDEDGDVGRKRQGEIPYQKYSQNYW